MAAVGTEVAMPCMADSHLVWIMNWFCLLFWGLCELPVSYGLAINQGVIASLGHSFFFYRHDISEESFGSKVIWVYISDRRPQRGIKKGEEEEFCLKNKLKLRKEKERKKKKGKEKKGEKPASWPWQLWRGRRWKEGWSYRPSGSLRIFTLLLFFFIDLFPPRQSWHMRSTGAQHTDHFFSSFI